jgi:coenzyme F420 biosynthesis associated uncharacterized protein
MTEPARQMVDWDFAVRLGAKIAGNGPAVDRAEGEAVVAELRTDAARATGLVREFTGLDAPEDTAPVLVVDRAGWVRANADAFARVLAPIVDTLIRKRPPTGVTRAVGAKVTGAEVGGLLGFLSSKVLGQFDPFHDPHGRLLLVAPNVVHVERELSVDPTDFRLWVCLLRSGPWPTRWTCPRCWRTGCRAPSRRSRATATCSTRSPHPSSARSWTGSPG